MARGGDEELGANGGYEAVPGNERSSHDILDDDDDEEEIVTKVHSLQNATWRDMRVGQQSAGDIFGRRSRVWPSMPTFTIGGILGGSGGGGGGIMGQGDGGDDEASGAWWRTVGRSPKAWRAWMVAGGVLIAVSVAIVFGGDGGGQEGVQSPLSAGAPRRPRDASQPPSDLRARLRSVADAALASGITRPMPTTFEIVRGGPPREGRESLDGAHAQEGVGGEEATAAGGMDFIISVISRGALEAKARTATPPASAASSDPFDERVLDPRMTVEEIPPAHSLVLNKFNTMTDHALIITRQFQPQDEALTEYDFVAWFHAVKDLPAVGFYNSAGEAGASQSHKHMQVIPEDALWDYRPNAPEAVPLDEPISRLVGSSRDLARIWQIPDFRFKHAFCLVPTFDELVAQGLVEAGTGGPGDQSRLIAAYMRGRYVDLLAAVGFDTSSILEQGVTATGASTGDAVSLPPYNAVLTTRWLLVVPRSTREWNGVDVNGMGFFGALLVRAKASQSGDGESGDTGVKAVRDPGPFAVLEAVSLPLE